MSEKMIGYILLIVGLGLVFFAGFSVYSVFTKQSSPVELFNFQAVSLSPEAFMSDITPEQKAALAEINQGESPQVELIPANILNESTNVFAHLLLMGFIASIGSRVASIGVSLLRPIVVKMTNDQVKDVRRQI